jgi:type IV secretory pathway TrbL component
VETLDVSKEAAYIQTAVVNGVHHSINGTTAPAANGLTFTESFGGVCTGQPGTYTVTTDAGGVHFTMVNDPCSVRAQDFTSGPWTRQ